MKGASSFPSAHGWLRLWEVKWLAPYDVGITASFSQVRKLRHEEIKQLGVWPQAVRLQSGKSKERGPLSHDSDLNNDFGRALGLDEWAHCPVSFLSLCSRYCCRNNLLISISCQRTQEGPGEVDMKTVACFQESMSQVQSNAKVDWEFLNEFHIPLCPDPCMTGVCHLCYLLHTPRRGDIRPTLIMAQAWALPWSFALIWAAARLPEKAEAQGQWCLQGSAGSVCYSHLSEILEVFK